MSPINEQVYTTQCFRFQNLNHHHHQFYFTISNAYFTLIPSSQCHCSFIVTVLVKKDQHFYVIW